MSKGGKLAWALVFVLAVIHFDFWAWEDDTLVFGFVPSALAYHVALSVAAAVAWDLVVRFDWPENIEAWAAGSDSGASLTSTGAEGEEPTDKTGASKRRES